MITVYGICGEDGKIRYIGQTARTLELRLRYHLCSDRTRVSRWLRRHHHKIFPIETNAVLGETERRLIAWYRRHGAALLNLSEGGEGNHGYKWTAQQIAAIKIRRRGRIITPKWRAAMSAALRGKKKPIGFGARISIRLTGKPKTEAHKRAISAGGMGRVVSAGTRAKLSVAHKGKPKTISPARRAQLVALAAQMRLTRAAKTSERGRAPQS